LYTIGPVSQLKLAFDFENTKFVPAYIPAAGTIPLGGPSYTGPTQGMDGYTQPSGLERQGGASVELTQQLSGIEFKSLTAFRRAHLDASIDGGLVTDPAYVLNIGIVDDHLQLTEELQLLSDTSSFIKWDTGAYFFYAEGRYDPVNVTGGLLAPLSSTKTWSHQTAASVAGFGQVTIAVLPKTDFTAGIRYTAEQRRYAGVSILNGFDGAPVAPPSTDVERATFRQPTWRLSLEHRFSDPMLGYVSYNRGFKSGGFNDDLVPTTRYAPETLDAFEIGSKTEWFGKRLRLDIATFLYDYKNIQAVTYPAGLEEIYNGAAARLYGLDLDLAAAVTRHLTLRCGVEVLRSRFSSFPDADFTTPVVGGGTNFGVFDAARHRLPIAPDWVADTSAEYAVQTGVGKLTVSASFGYNNGWYAEPDNRLKQPAYGLLNASVSWSSRDGVYGIRLWGKNLANSQYVVALASQSNGDFAQYAPPRTFGIVFTQSL
jgi:iron complex outermembrane receptor protein